MVRDNLEGIPVHTHGGGYCTRNYVDGDQAAWGDIWRRADTLENRQGGLFMREFSHDLTALDRRCFFLIAPDGTRVGTATAWYNKKYHGKPWGMVHWVAIVPEHQGKGQSKAMMTTVMQRLKSLGHRRAMLGTQSVRLTAIRVYLDFGFRPHVTSDQNARAWSLVADELQHPALKNLKGV